MNQAKLQRLERGRWRTLLAFDPARWAEVQDAAASLVRATVDPAMWRILIEGETRVLQDGVFRVRPGEGGA